MPRSNAALGVVHTRSPMLSRRDDQYFMGVVSGMYSTLISGVMGRGRAEGRVTAATISSAPTSLVHAWVPVRTIREHGRCGRMGRMAVRAG